MLGKTLAGKSARHMCGRVQPIGVTGKGKLSVPDLDFFAVDMWLWHTGDIQLILMTFACGGDMLSMETSDTFNRGKVEASRPLTDDKYHTELMYAQWDPGGQP